MPLPRDFRLDPRVRPVRYRLHFDVDLERWRFGGTERLDLTIDGPPRAELVLHGRDLELSDVRIDGRLAAVTVAADANAIVLRPGAPLAAGAHTVELALAGEIRADLKALYRSTRGDDRYAITTLWPAESRRLFACFDEPPFKARFDLSVTAASHLQAVANTLVVERRDLGGGRTLWRFAETPPLSPYLLAFAVGPFAATDELRTRSGVPVRLWLPSGLEGDARWANEAQRDCIDLLEEYTAVPYPYDKVEGIGAPDFPAGAMENPGLVTYRLDLVAVDPARSAVRALKSSVGVAAHELTHMWWGDLVTLAWWDDLWLSESFATFVGHRIEAALHPEWGVWRDFVRGTARGFALDALSSTHAIHAEAASAEAALQRVDAITYEKGAAVLRMLEAYLGAERFRAGVRIYLERFREASATAADFWRALDEASGEDVSRIASVWISEPGHPLVTLRDEGNGRVAVAQRRWSLDPDATPSAQRWPVPLVLRTPTGEVRTILDRERDVVDIGDAAWVHPNSRAAGFYRFTLDAALRARSLANVRALDALERLSLVDNDWALLRAGAVDVASYVALLRALRGERDRAVLAEVADQLQWLAAHALPAGGERAFEDLVTSLLGPVLDALGWGARAGDGGDERELRALAIAGLGTLAGAAPVRAAARRRVEAHLDGDRQDADVIAACAGVAATWGDEDLQRRYVAHLRAVRATDPQDERRFRDALALFPGARLTLEAIDDGTVRDQDLAGIFHRGLRNVVARESYWRALRERYDRRIAPLEGMVRNGIIAAAAELTPAHLAEEADAFLSQVAESDSQEVVPRLRESLRLAAGAARRIERGWASVASG